MSTATLLPLARFVAYDANGAPLAGGFVHTYVPGGSTPKTTWQDADETTPNSNPIVLDADGSCLLYGSGNYQITVTDSLGNAVPGYSGLSADTVSQAGISDAMIPVVGASTTAVALALLGGPLSFPTIFDLQAYAGGTFPTAFVQTRLSTTKTGGGTYWYNAADTTSPGNGGTIVVDASNRRWYLVTNDEPINIMLFGGVADGVTDNSAALANAYRALPPQGGTIYFPAGNFAFDSQVVITFPNFTASLEIAGAGPNATTLTFPNASGGMQFNYVVPASPTGNGYGSANSVNIHDMMFVTAQAGTADGITLNMSGNQQNSPSSGQNVISNVFFQGIDGPFHSGIYWRNEVNIAGVSYVNLISVCGYGDGTRAHGNGLTVSGSVTNPAVVFNCFGCSWNTEKIGINYGEYAQGVAAICCNFTGTTFGIAAQAGLPDGQQVQLTVVGCQFNCFSACIAGTSQITTVLISANLFFVETGAQNAAITGGFEGFAITGNYLFGPADGTAIGIFIDTNTLSRGGLITGNSIGGFDVGIDLEAGSGGVNVQSNQYFSNTTNTINSGTGNTIGGGSA